MAPSSTPSAIENRKSFDDLVRSHQHVRWNRPADLLRGLESDYELKLRGLLDGQVGGLCAFWTFVRIVNSSYRSGRPR